MRMRTFEVTFWEDSATCVGSAIIEAGSDDALRDKSRAYAKYVLVPQGFEAGGMKHHEVARGNTDGHISGCVPYRFFPILQLPQHRYIAEYVPYEVVKEHESQAMKNHGGQTVDRLAQRGGLAWDELYCTLTDSPLSFRDHARSYEWYKQECDKIIVERLKDENDTHVARRTIVLCKDCKYRESCGIKRDMEVASRLAQLDRELFCAIGDRG